MQYVPKYVFFVRGFGYHKIELASFEHALSMAGINALNLVYVSSIFPPHCKILSPKKGISLLKHGSITHCVMARQSINEHNRLAGASVGLAIPKDNGRYGYLSEVHGCGINTKQIGDQAEDLAAEFLAASLGLPFDQDKNWNERKESWMLEGQIVKTTAFPIVKTGKAKQFLTVISAAVFLDGE